MASNRKNNRKAAIVSANDNTAIIETVEGIVSEIEASAEVNAAIETTQEINADAIVASTVLPGTLPTGVVSYLAFDSVTGSVFVSEQPRAKAYQWAVIADSPLGRKVVRLSSDYKASVRYVKAINERGASACSGAIIVDVRVDDKPHRESVQSGQAMWVTRNRKAIWDNAAAAMRGQVAPATPAAALPLLDSAE